MTKKKSRRDPVKDKIKDDRRMKRLTKALRKMEKKDRQPKPIIEMEVPNVLYSLDRKLIAQQEALDQLRQESMELYLEACQIDPDLVPFTAKGPTLTPPIKDYIQDGEFKDVTREYKVIYEDTEAFLKKLVSKVRKRKKKEEDEE